MGTISYYIAKPGRTGVHQGIGLFPGQVRTSASAATTAITASDLAGLTIRPGEFFFGVASTNMWLNPYGTAVVGTGIMFQANILNVFEFDPDGDTTGAKAARAVSTIDG